MKTDFFKDKVAIVTGSSQGIGKAIALELLKRGAKVVINGRNIEKLKRTEILLSNIGEVTAVASDVSTSNGAAMLIAKAIYHYDKVDILINNAGLSMKGNLADLCPDVYRKVFDANILGSVNPTIYALSKLRENNGSVVFISSVAGIRGLPNHSAYCSSKMALRAVAESLRIEEANTGLHVGLMYVGFTKNETHKKTLNEVGELVSLDDRSKFKQQSPTEVACAVLENIEKRKFISTLSWLGKINRWMQALFPMTTEALLTKMTKKQKDTPSSLRLASE